MRSKAVAQLRGSWCGMPRGLVVMVPPARVPGQQPTRALLQPRALTSVPHATRTAGVTPRTPPPALWTAGWPLRLPARAYAVRAGLSAAPQGTFGGDSRGAGHEQQERPLAEMARDYDRFFDILTLPTQSPMVAKREELKLVELDEDTFFRDRLRTAKHYNLLIRAQAEAKKPLDLIQRTFENMLRHHVQPSVEVYTSMIVACAKSGNPEEAERYFSLMKEASLVPNIWTYTALAQAYTRSGKLDDAFRVLERVKEAGIRPNVVLYTSLVHGCLLVQNVDRAWDTFDYMRQREAIEPDEVAFTLMIHACAKKSEVERAENLVEEMKLLQLQPTEVTFNSQINACAQRRDYYKEAFLNLERMKAAGFRPDEITYATLLHASAKNGDIKMAETLFRTMNDSGMIVAKPEATRRWNSLLSAYATAQPKADSITRSKSITTASRIVEAMYNAGQQPDIYTANTMLSLYAHAHRIKQTEIFFEASAESAAQTPTGNGDTQQHSLWRFSQRFQPDVVTYTCLIQLYADTRRPEKALQVWHMMNDSGIEPNMRTYEYMVRALARASYLNTAMKILRQMRDRGFIPHDDVVNLLMLRTQAYPDLREEVRRLAQLPLPDRVDPKSILAIRLRRAQRKDRDPFAPRGSSSRRRALPLHRPV